MALDVRIATGSAVPIYRQIVDQVCLAVANGVVANGDRLPSVRALAERLVVNPNTVARAYADIVIDGVIESRHGRGAFVAKRRQVYSRTERSRRLEGALDRFISETLVLDFTHDEIRDALDRKLQQLGRGQSQKGGARHDR